MARIEKHLEISPIYIDSYDDELCEECGGDIDLPHEHLISVFIPECEICGNPLKHTSTVSGKKSYSCMTERCTNLSRYNSKGERFGTQPS